MDYNTVYILDWIKRMSDKFGGIVYTKDGQKFDWGQALCRERWGKNWNEILTKKNIVSPDYKDIEIAKEWEETGIFPFWTKQI